MRRLLLVLDIWDKQLVLMSPARREALTGQLAVLG